MDDTVGYLERLWRDAKCWRSLRFGPLTMHFRFSRAHRRPTRSVAFPATTRAPSPRIASGKTAMVAGIGEQIGPAVVQKLAAEGMQVAALSRSALSHDGNQNVRGYQCDATDERAVGLALHRPSAEAA